MKKLILALLFLPLLAFADTVTFAWDPVTTDTSGDPITVTGYKLYTSATSGVYPATPATDVTGTSASVNLVPGTYFAVATAYNDAGESDYSNEITFRVTLKPSIPQHFRLTSQ